MDFVYPRKQYSEDDTPSIPDSEIAEIIIACREAGDSKTMAELHALSVCHSKGAVKRISNQIEEDIAALCSVNPLDYDTVQEFVSTLNGASTYVQVSTWADYLQDKHDIPDGTAAQRFAALKAKLTPEA